MSAISANLVALIRTPAPKAMRLLLAYSNVPLEHKGTMIEFLQRLSGEAQGLLDNLSSRRKDAKLKGVSLGFTQKDVDKIKAAWVESQHRDRHYIADYPESPLRSLSGALRAVAVYYRRAGMDNPRQAKIADGIMDVSNAFATLFDSDNVADQSPESAGQEPQRAVVHRKVVYLAEYRQ